MSTSLTADFLRSADVRLLTTTVVVGGAKVRLDIERVPRHWGQAGMPVTDLVTGLCLHALSQGCRNSGPVTA